MKSKRYDKNVETIKALEAAGSNMGQKHNIEHHLYCYSNMGYQRLVELAKAAGYRIMYERIADYGEGKEWELDLVKIEKPTLATIEAQSLEVEGYAEETKSEYDGWGTEIET